MALNVEPTFITIAFPMIVSDITELHNQVIAQIVVTMMAFVPFFGDLSGFLCSSFSAWTTVVFRLVVVPSCPSILIRLEQPLFCAFTCQFNVICICRTINIMILWRSPANGIVALVLVISLWPIELALYLVFERWLVNMVLLLFKIFESAPVSIIQITVALVLSFLANCELDAVFVRGTKGVAFFF